MNVKIETVEDLVTVIQVCAWAFVVTVIMFVFGGTVFSMLYSVIFVSQPIKTMAPIDQAFTKMLNDIVLILASSVTTIVSMFAVNKGIQSAAEKIAPSLGIPPTTPTTPLPVSAPQSVTSSYPNFNWMGFQNPELDETWRPGPPPTTAEDYLHPEREEIANERALAGAA